jgi:hypothetical protein
MHHSSTTDASEQDRSNPLRLCSAPRPPAAITFLLPWPLSLSLKRVYLYRKLIILNEKNKSALNG